jgi:membrane protease YdiL (CAAX protease family)
VSYPLSGVSSQEAEATPTNRLMGLVMVVVMLTGYIVVVPVVNTAVTGLGFAVSGSGVSWQDYTVAASQFRNVWGLLAAHLGLAALVLVVWALFHFVHHRPLAWLWSVSPGVRWRYGLLCLIAAAIIMGAVTAFQASRGTGWNPPSDWGWYAVVIVATTPFQAMAEEVMFRGYLMQAFGTVVRQVWFPIIATAVIFALFHGVQNPWLFGSRLVFGLLAGVLVWRTGGLESAIAIHIVNNLCVFGLALFTGALVQARTMTEVGWGQAVSDVLIFAACSAACWGLARLLRVPTMTPTAGVARAR